MKKFFKGLFQIRGSVSQPWSVVLGLIPLAWIVFIWWFVTKGAIVEERMISPVILPSPLEVVQQIPLLLTKGKLIEGAVASFVRVGIGFLLAIAVALPLGIAMGSFSRVKAMFQPIAVMGGYLPIAALVPLTLVWFGTSEKQKYMFLAIAFFVYVLPLIVKAMDKVDDVFVQSAYTLGAGRWQIATKVLIPIAFYDIWQALRLAFGIGWSYIILAEVILSDAGLGQIITVAQRRGPREYIYLVILVIALLAFSTDKIMGWVGNKLFPYRKNEEYG
ncbi:MAG: ABC transporter permease [Candidatus Omnitrophota bacterium]